MKAAWTSILITEHAWTLGLSDGTRVSTLEVPLNGSATDPSVITQAVSAAVQTAKQAKATFRPLMIGLPSSWCFSAQVSTENLQKRQRTQGLTYRFEEKLPVDAETFTASFKENSKQAWGVAVTTGSARRVLNALENAGLTVAHFCPTALLLHDAASSERTLSDEAIHVVSADPSTVDVVITDNGDITAWRSLPLNTDLITTEIHAITSNQAPASPIRCVGLTPGTTEQLRINLRQDLNLAHPSPPEAQKAFALHSDQLLRRGSPPPIDLRHGALAGRGTWPRVATPARAAAAVAIVLLLSITIGNLLVVQQYQATTHRHEDQQAALFRETFPGQRLPAAPLARFRSEAIKARGTAGDDETRPAAPRTLHTLQTTLASLPASPGSNNSETRSSGTKSSLPYMRFRLFELRLESDRFYLDGQTRSHADAERLADGLRESLPYAFTPPRTQNLDRSGAAPGSASRGKSGGRGGVAFTLTGQREGETP